MTYLHYHQQYHERKGTLFVVCILSLLCLHPSHGLLHPKTLFVHNNKMNHNNNIRSKKSNHWNNYPTSFYRLDRNYQQQPTTILTMSTFDNKNKPNISNSSDITTSNEYFQASTEDNDISDTSISSRNSIVVPKINEFQEKIQSLFDKWQGSKESSSFQLPPLIVEDQPLLLYDIFLLINLSLSISFWVVHRMSFEHIATALSEGSLLCIIWIISGLYHGSFLYSSVDGHYRNSEEGGPKSAGMLALSTFITTANIRIVVALIMALIEH